MVKKAEKPKHAPSAKLALDDVLKSLQDLIRNDLADVNSARVPVIPTPTETATHSNTLPPSTKEVIHELEAGLAELSLPLTDPAAPAVAHIPPEDIAEPNQVLVCATPEQLPVPEPASMPPEKSELLQDITPAEVDMAPLADPAPPPDPTASSEFLQDEPPMDSEIASLDNVTLDFGHDSHSAAIEWDQHLGSTPDPTPPAPSLAGTLELELPALEPPMASPTSQAADVKQTPAAPLEQPKVHNTVLAQGLQTELPLPPPQPPAPAAATQPGLEQAWDDSIPILQDTIDALEPTATAPAASIRPQDEAHRMAIQIAARLNVDLRRAGKPALSSDTVTRLVYLLQEALAQSALNVDNRPQR